MKKQIYYCKGCGLCSLLKIRPKKCKICKSDKIGRLLTEDDLNKFKN